MRLLAPPLGFVVVQPSAPGLPATWGLGEHDDVVWDFVVATADLLDTDPDRLHFMGFSQGSMMSFRMLCAHADAIASIAPDSGGDCFTVGGTPAVERLVDPASQDMDALWIAEWEKQLLTAAVTRLKSRLDPEKYQIFDLYVIKEWPVRDVTGTLHVSAAQVYLAKLRVSRMVQAEIRRLESKVK
jgi:pimeloyl-ACP methyl ester carboxylesterase